MILLRIEDVQLLQIEKTSTDRKGDGWLFLQSVLIHLQKVSNNFIILHI